MTEKQDISSNESQFDALNPLDDLVSKEQSPQQAPNTISPKPPEVGGGNWMLDAILKDIDAGTPENAKPQEFVINWLEDLAVFCVQNSYDYFKIEPQESDVEVTFVKEDREAEKKFIKFPLYTSITLKAKNIAWFDLAVTDKVQEGKWELKAGGKTYIIMTKSAPWKYGESLFVKVKIQEIKVKKRMSFGQLLSFFWATSFVAFVMWAAFITFVILNAKTVDDVRFFNDLWIKLNDINTFIGKIVFFIFSILVFIETIVLAVFLFKFYLTKKTEKSRKRTFGIISWLLLLITFSTAYGWLDLDKRIKALPNWQEVDYGDVQILDNEKLISDKFDKSEALIKDTTRLIWPITLKYDLSLFQEKEEKQGYKVVKYIWNFGSGESEEKLDPIMIKLFDKSQTYNVSLVVEEIDPLWKTIEKKVENVRSVSIDGVVKVKREVQKNGGVLMEFDASELKEKGRIEWFMENADGETKLAWSGAVFIPWQIFYEEALIGMYIREDTNTEKGETFDKIFVVMPEQTNNIGWTIEFKQDLENDLKYTFSVKDIKTAFWDWLVKEFKWKFTDKEEIKVADAMDVEWSSIIVHDFTSYWKQDIKVTMKDASGNVKELTTSINIVKVVRLKESLKISDGENTPIETKYEAKTNEYYINGLWIPSKLKFDARDVRADNIVYSLSEIQWDVWDDGKKEGKGNTFEYQIDTEGNYTIAVNYIFKHRKIVTDTVILTQKVYVEAVKKEAIIDFKIEKDSNYAPVVVKLDGSRSTVKDDNIIKFTYDYGDGIVDERWEAIVDGHLYGKAGEYTIKLTVQTEKGKKYTTAKKLVLSPKPQVAEIGVSMKQAPIGQWIDFSSDKSEWQIVSYYWNFGDGTDSTDANPTHAYKKTWSFKVLLKVGFSNGNFEEDTLTIVIE